MGHWNYIEVDGRSGHQCSNCGIALRYDATFRYCLNCGDKMDNPHHRYDYNAFGKPYPDNAGKPGIWFAHDLEDSLFFRMYKCSECGAESTLNHPPYCPFCGAKCEVEWGHVPKDDNL